MRQPRPQRLPGALEVRVVGRRGGREIVALVAAMVVRGISLTAAVMVSTSRGVEARRDNETCDTRRHRVLLTGAIGV